jgi:hypothetical protein
VKRHGSQNRGFGRSPLACLVSALALALAGVAQAHVPVLRGRLVELVRHCDTVVIGTAERVEVHGPRLIDTAVRVKHVLLGSWQPAIVTFRGPTRFAPGQRYVFFLRHGISGFEGIQESGTVFPAAPADDAIYRRTVTAIAHALHTDPSQQTDALRAALIPALSAHALPLRYHAALELAALAEGGHGPTRRERRDLQRVLARPDTDPALRPVLTQLLRE